MLDYKARIFPLSFVLVFKCKAAEIVGDRSINTERVEVQIFKRIKNPIDLEI